MYYKVGDIVKEDVVDPASGEIVAEEGDVVTEERAPLINSILRDITAFQNAERSAQVGHWS